MARLSYSQKVRPEVRSFGLRRNSFKDGAGFLTNEDAWPAGPSERSSAASSSSNSRLGSSNLLQPIKFSPISGSQHTQEEEEEEEEGEARTVAHILSDTASIFHAAASCGAAMCVVSTYVKEH